MNDAHIYCTLDQVAQEFADNIRMVQDYYAAFGFENYHFQLSLWDPARALTSTSTSPRTGRPPRTTSGRYWTVWGCPYVETSRRGRLLRAQGRHPVHHACWVREESMSTIQLDFAAKERFCADLQGRDRCGERRGLRHPPRPALDPREVRSLPNRALGWQLPDLALAGAGAGHHHLGEAQAARCEGGRGAATQAGVRSQSGRLRQHHRQEDPPPQDPQRPAYMVVIGDEESENGTVAIRERGGGNQRNGVALDEFVADIFAEITNRSTELGIVPPE